MIRTQIQLPDKLHRHLKRIARDRECSLAEVVRRASERYVRTTAPELATDETWEMPSLPPSGGMLRDPAEVRGEVEALNRHHP